MKEKLHLERAEEYGLNGYALKCAGFFLRRCRMQWAKCCQPNLTCTIEFRIHTSEKRLLDKIKLLSPLFVHVDGLPKEIMNENLELNLFECNNGNVFIWKQNRRPKETSKKKTTTAHQTTHHLVVAKQRGKIIVTPEIMGFSKKSKT